VNDGSSLNPSLTRPGGIRLPFFYGWLLLAIAFVTIAVGVNARTAFSLLFPAILDEFGGIAASPPARSHLGFSSRRWLPPLSGG